MDSVYTITDNTTINTSGEHGLLRNQRTWNDSVKPFKASGHTLNCLFVLSDRFCFITPLILWISGFCTILPNYDLIFNTYKIPNAYMCDFIEITQLTKTKTKNGTFVKYFALVNKFRTVYYNYQLVLIKCCVAEVNDKIVFFMTRIWIVGCNE